MMGVSTVSTGHLQRLFLGALLALLLAAAVAGAIVPAASASPDAATIDAFLQDHQSPMVGSGAAFVAEGQAHGIDPAFLVAVAGAETSFGRYLYSRDGDQCTYNAFNYFYGDTWPQSDFTSWDEGIGRVAEGIAGGLYYGDGLTAVATIGPRYCPDGTDDWMRNVSAFMTALGGDPSDTRVTPVLATPTPTPTPSTSPELIDIAGSVVVEGDAQEVGGTANLRFALRNNGTQPVSLEGIRLAVRGPTGAAADLVSDQPCELTPGRWVQVVGAVPLDRVGLWTGWIEVRRDGAVERVGSDPAFTFDATLPRGAEALRRMALKLALSRLD